VRALPSIASVRLGVAACVFKWAALALPPTGEWPYRGTITSLQTECIAFVDFINDLV